MIAILDEVEVEKSILVSHCHAAWWAFLAAATFPERVAGIVAISPGIPFIGDPNPHWTEVEARWDDVPIDPQGWEMCNPAFWRRGGYEDWIRFWFDLLATEPHSTKLVEDMVGWALETDPDTMAMANDEETKGATPELAEWLCRSVQCPVLVLHGS